MKNLLIILLIAGFYSCKKCKDCTTVTTTSVSTPTPGYPQTSQATFEACDDDLKSVDGKTTTATATAGTVTATSVAKTTCR